MHAPPQPPGKQTQLPRVALSGMPGTAVEFYGFLVYGTLAALVFGELFFPRADPAVGTIAAFGTFAAGYAARPLGSMIFGHFGDRVGRRPVVLTGALLSAALAFPVMALVDSGNPGLLLLALVLGHGVAQSTVYGPLGALLTEMFGTRVRYTGASLHYQMATLIGAGFSPLIAGSLVAANNGSGTPLAVLLCAGGAVTAPAVWRIRETNRDELTERTETQLAPATPEGIPS